MCFLKYYASVMNTNELDFKNLFFIKYLYINRLFFYEFISAKGKLKNQSVCYTMLFFYTKNNTLDQDLYFVSQWS